MFSHFGLPDQLVSDNGPQFTSDEFTQFLKRNGIKHILSAPYHPSSNGQADQSFFSPTELLPTQQQMPHATTDASPSELFLQRQVRTRFDLLKPDHKGLIASRQNTQKKQHDRHAKLRNLAVGSPVMVRDFCRNSKWVPGTIVKKLGPVTYHVDLLQCPKSLPVSPNETAENSTIKDNLKLWNNPDESQLWRLSRFSEVREFEDLLTDS